MRFVVRLAALLLALGALLYLVWGAYWVNPEAFRTKLKLMMGAFREDARPGERGKTRQFYHSGVPAWSGTADFQCQSNLRN